MPKMKTRSAAKKRFTKVGSRKSKKIKRSKAFRRHLLTKKSSNRKRGLRERAYISKADYPSVSLLLPY